MFIPMYIVLTSVLSEHNLIKAENTPTFNLNRITLILLDFLHQTTNDFDVECKEEIVRAADLTGVKLVPSEGIEISEDDLERWRFRYAEAEVDPPDSDSEPDFNEKA
jgi:hypothetical protein